MSRLNIERLGEIAGWLESGTPEVGEINGGFNMRTAFGGDPECGTTCCIAGAAIEFNAPFRARQMQWDADVIYPRPFAAYLPHPTTYWPQQRELARNLLGMGKLQARDLFQPGADHGFSNRDEWQAITPAWAARCIRHLIATGKIDWQGTKEAQAMPENVVQIRAVA